VSDQLKSALIRAAITAVVAAALSFLTGLSQGQTYKAAGISAGIVFFSNVLTRGLGEGYIDTNTAGKAAAAAKP
jgi:hypothetical protein